MSEVTVPDGKAIIHKEIKQLLVRAPTFETWYYFVLKANNGEIIATSENYTQKHNAIEIIEKYFSNFMMVDETGE